MWRLWIFKPAGFADVDRFRSLILAFFVFYRVLLRLRWFLDLRGCFWLTRKKAGRKAALPFEFLYISARLNIGPSLVTWGGVLSEIRCSARRFNYETDLVRMILNFIENPGCMECRSLLTVGIRFLSLTVSQFYPGRRGTNGTAHADGTFPEHCGRFRP